MLPLFPEDGKHFQILIPLLKAILLKPLNFLLLMLNIIIIITGGSQVMVLRIVENGLYRIYKSPSRNVRYGIKFVLTEFVNNVNK